MATSWRNLTRELNGGFQVDMQSVSPYKLNDSFLCDYRDEEYFTTVPNPCHSLFMVGLNIQSLNAKKERLLEFTESLNTKFKRPDIISIQETFLTPNTPPPEINGYHPIIHNCRHNSKGGGVGILINERLSFVENTNLTIFIERIFESVCVDVFAANKKFSIVNIYRPPSSPNFTESQAIDLFFINLHKLLSSCPSNTYVFMDANINLIGPSTLGDRFYDTFQSRGFQSNINRLTRVTENSVSQIDHIFCNNNEYSGISGPILTDISDHFPIFISFPLNKRIDMRNKTISRRFFTDENLCLFENALSNFSWDSVINLSETNEALQSFLEIWNTLFEQCFPLKRVMVNRSRYRMNDFYTHGLLISRKTKLSLYSKFIRERTKISELEFKKYRNCYNRVIKLAKKLFLNNKIDQSNDPKTSWNCLKESIGLSRNAQQNINNICINNICYTDPQMIADKFNDYFSSITDEIVSNIPDTSASFSNYLPTQSMDSFTFSSVNTECVLEVVKSLESKKSLDIMGCNTFLIKRFVNSIIRPLTHIINLSLINGYFPDSLKTSRVCPVFKQNDRSCMNNYRPISLLPAFSKIFEKIVFNQLFAYLSFNNIISPNQFGFQKGKSTSHALLKIINYITTAFNENKFVVGVFIDMSKAFDMVNHEILLAKLRNLGISEISLNWFSSYLSNRKMFTNVNGKLSKLHKTLKRSVPQGSILGPLLFLIFINDMPNSNELLNILFADDTTALASGTDIMSVGNLVNNEIQKLGIWLRANELAINPSKTKVMVFSNHRSIPEFRFVFNNNDLTGTQNPNLIYPIERVSNKSQIPAVKMLGVYLDEHLSFNFHCTKVLKKVSSALYMINRAKHFLSSASLKKLYYSIIHPHFLYCLIIYSSTNDSNINLLFKKQKQCIRTISNAKYNAHTEPLFFAMEILPLKDLIEQQKLLFMHSLRYGYSAVHFDCFITNNEAGRNTYALRNNAEFVIPRSSCAKVTKMPLIDFPYTWNNTDSSITEISQKIYLKKQ